MKNLTRSQIAKNQHRVNGRFARYVVPVPVPGAESRKILGEKVGSDGPFFTKEETLGVDHRGNSLKNPELPWILPGSIVALALSITLLAVTLSNL